MTYEDDYSIPEEVLEQICSEGFDALPDPMKIVMNTTMRMERQKHQLTDLYERTPRNYVWRS